MWARRAALALLPLALLGAARAEPSAGEGAAEAGPREVFRVDPVVDGAVIGVTALGNLVPWLLEDRIIRVRCPCDPGEVNRFDRWAIGLHSDAAATASEVTVWLALLGPPAADALALGRSRALLEDAVVFAEALSVNGALATLAKYTTQRPIPRAYEGEASYLGKPGSYRAFWSGHTSTAATALVVAAWTLRLRYGEQGWPWWVAALGTASVAVERVAGGHHFPTDVIVGAAAGWTVGTAIPLLHRRPDGAVALGVAPAGRGLALVGRF